ncbi:MAG: Uma2 family endonuclease [Armatimonadetes bacterium]|nr:Uma2 family endonuclease [Armatimonadota bacterium]
MLAPRVIEYPTSDGRPLGETDVHREQIIDLIHALEIYFRGRSDVYVSGNILLFYEEGKRRKHRSPDVLVTLGIPAGQRDYYLLWEEGKAPDFIIEVTSKSTRMEDFGIKKALYAAIGVREYYIFDPLREYLTPSLRAYRLQGEEYVPMTGAPMVSAVLGVELRLVDDRLRIFDPGRGELLPTRAESQARAEQEAARADREAARANEALLENERLKAELQRLRSIARED